jgi:hypothetical protein
MTMDSREIDSMADGGLARLLDVALAEAAGGRTAPDVSAQVLARVQGRSMPLAPVRPRPTPRVLAAALLVLGVAVVAAVAALRPTREPAVQEPEPETEPELAPPFFYRKNTADGELPADVQYLWISINAVVAPGMTDRIAALQQLRCLQLLRPAPAELPAEVFATIARLPKLVDLRSPLLTPALLAQLRPAPRLRALTIFGKGVRLDEGLTAALAELPHLRTLRLQGMELSAADVRKLADVQHLETLRIESVGCTEPVLQELKGLVALRRLELAYLGRTPLASVKSPPRLESCGLTADVARTLAGLPLFDDLFLEHTELADGAIAELPLGLRRLSLTHCPDITPAQLRSLRRLVHVEYLHLDRVDERWCPNVDRGFPRPPTEPTPRWQAQADLVRALPQLRELAYDWFQPPDEVVDAMAALPLRAVTLYRVAAIQPWLSEDGDLKYLARLPQLERLRLGGFQGTVADLAVLRDARRLRQLDVGPPTFFDGLAGPALAERLRKELPGVTVHLHAYQ